VRVMRPMTPGVWVLIVVAAVAAAFGLYKLADRLWVTDAERVAAVIERGRSASERGDADEIARLFTSDFQIEGRDAKTLALWAVTALREIEARTIVISEEKITPLKTKYEAELVARMGPTRARLVYEVGVRMRFTRPEHGRRGNEWLVERIEVFDPTDGRPYTDLKIPR